MIAIAVELATGYVSVVPTARGFEKTLRDETDSAGRRAGDAAGDEFSGAFGGSLKKLAAIAAAAFAGLQVGQFLKSSVTAASDLSESVSKVGVVFGDSAGDIQDWAKTAATSLGQSRQQALEAAGTFGNLFVALKIGAPQAATMSKKMIELAGDLASFNNVSPEEALDALRSGLVGETEPLRRFGVNLNDATLKAKAMELGLSDGKATLDANAKAQAAYALILEQTGTAQGDFARTSAGLANQQRILSAQWTDLKATIGNAFLPLLINSGHVLTTTVLPALQRFAELAGPVVTKALQDFKSELDGIGTPAEGVFAKLGDKVGSVIRWFRIEIPDAITALVAAFKSGGDDITSSGFAGAMETLGQKLRDLVDLVKNNPGVFKPLAAGIAGVAATAGVASVGGGGLSVFTGLISALPAVFSLATNPIGLTALAIGGLAAASVIAYQKIEPFRQAVDRVKEAFKTGGFKAAVDQAGVEFGRLWDVVKPKLDEFFAAVGPWLTAHAPGILEGLKTGWLAFANFMATEFWPFLAEKLLVLLEALGGWIRDTAAPAIKEKLLDWAHAFGDWVSETAWPWLRDKLPVLLGDLAAWIRDTALPEIEAKLIEWGEAFGDWVDEKAVPWIKENLPKILAAIQDWMTGTVIPELGKMATNMATELLKFAGETVIRMPGELARISAQIAFWAVQTTMQIPGWVIGIGIAIIQGIVSGALNALGLLSNLGQGIRNAITGGLGYVGDLLYGAGQSVIRGLINGIRDTIPGLNSVLGGITNLIPRLKGPPAKDAMLLYRNGQLIMGGLIDGIASKTGALRNQLGGISTMIGGGSTMSMAVSGSYGAATVGGAGIIGSTAPAATAGGGLGGSPTININAPLGVDRQEVVAAVQAGLRQYDAARKGTN